MCLLNSERNIRERGSSVEIDSNNVNFSGIRSGDKQVIWNGRKFSTTYIFSLTGICARFEVEYMC